MPATEEAIIQKTPGRMGGQACIRRTRISVWILVGYKQLGLSDPELLEAYPTLNQEDLDAAWDYYAANKKEVDDAIRLNEED